MRIIAGKFKGRVLTVPKTTTTRPTQGSLREAVFNICQLEIENGTFLDLFAGSGAMGFEALSRGASHITLIETNKEALVAIQKNIALLNVASEVSLLKLDALVAIDRLKTSFDMIYVDPPYTVPVAPILQKIEASHLLKPGGILFVEERYHPKKEAAPFTSSKLLLKSARRFGSALLHQYLGI